MFHRDLIVVGASAGGVEALLTLARGFPEDLPASVCVVLHMAANAPGLMPKLMSDAGPLSASHAMDGEPLEPGRIYVAPPDHHLLVDGDRLRLGRGAKENRSRPAVDPLFRTAATSHGPRVIAVILSGWLNDGAAGCVAVQRCNGLVVVQDPSTDRTGEMATNVLKLIRVDHVLPVAGIAPALMRLATESLPGQGAFTVPEDLRIETDISRQQSLTPDEKLELVERLGARTALTCPECNGNLWQMNGEPLRYRCHVGHAFSAEALSEGQASAVESSLWSAVRALEEQTLASHRLAELAKARDDLGSAEKFEKRAGVAQQHAKVINQLLLRKIVEDPNAEEE